MKVLNQSNISLITRRDLWTCYTGGNDLDIAIIARHHLCLNHKPSSLLSLALVSAMTDLWLILVIKCRGICKFEDHVGAGDWWAKRSESFILLVESWLGRVTLSCFDSAVQSPDYLLSISLLLKCGSTSKPSIVIQKKNSLFLITIIDLHQIEFLLIGKIQHIRLSDYIRVSDYIHDELSLSSEGTNCS